MRLRPPSELELDITNWTGNNAQVLAYTVDDSTDANDVVVDDIARDGILLAGDRASLRRGLAD